MAFIHGKNTVVLWGATDLSTYTESTDWNYGVEAEETTTYGPTRENKSFSASLGTGTITCKGTSDDGVAGPDAVLQTLQDAKNPVTFTFRPKGTGAGKPQQIVDVLITAFNISQPAGGYCKWTCDMQMSGTVNRANQP